MNEPTRSASELAQLYRDVIKRHASEPVGYRAPIAATHRHEEYNPLCGDRIEVALLVEHDRVEAAAFDGEACAICMASASLLCSLAPGVAVSRLESLGKELQQALSRKGERPEDRARTDAELPQELQPLLGVRPYPSRVRCATLPWTAAMRALAE